MRFEYDEPQMPAQPAPLIEVLRLLGTRWSVWILFHLAHGPSRYSNMRRSIPGLSEKALTECLGKLHANGLVERNVWPTQPGHVEYSLTPSGSELIGYLHELQAWVEASGLVGR